MSKPDPKTANQHPAPKTGSRNPRPPVPQPQKAGTFRKMSLFQQKQYPAEIPGKWKDGRPKAKSAVASMNLAPGERLFGHWVTKGETSRRRFVCLTWTKAKEIVETHAARDEPYGLFEIIFSADGVHAHRTDDVVYPYLDVDGKETTFKEQWHDPKWQAESRKKWVRRFVDLLVKRFGDLGITIDPSEHLRISTAAAPKKEFYKHSLHATVRHPQCALEGGPVKYLKRVMEHRILCDLDNPKTANGRLPHQIFVFCSLIRFSMYDSA